MATKNCKNRRWSTNVTYTGLANIHSEVLSGVAARNTSLDRRSSYSVTTKSNLHQKELRHLDSERKALKTSMLAYTEKMKLIATQKTSCGLHSQNDNTSQLHNLEEKDRSICARPGAAKPIPSQNMNHILQDKQHVSETRLIHGIDGQLNSRDRMSTDSGIGLDENFDNLSQHDFSDSCCSDSEDARSVRDIDCVCSDTEGKSASSDMFKNKRRLRKRWRINQDIQQQHVLPTVVDEDWSECCVSGNESEAFENESYVSVVPFPPGVGDDFTNQPHQLSREHSNVSSPLSSHRQHYWSLKEANSDPDNEKAHFVVHKPKAIQSPSVVSYRNRHKPRKQIDQSINKHVGLQKSFRYSEIVESNTLKHGDVQGNFNTQGDLIDSFRHTDNACSMNTIYETNYDLNAGEGCLTPTSTNDIFYEHHFEIISERNTPCLKSVMKSGNVLGSHKKKHVRFLLPHIIKKPLVQL